MSNLELVTREGATASETPTWTPLELGPIQSHDRYQQVADYLKSIKAFQKRVTDFFAPHKARALESHRALCADEKKALDPALQDEAGCKRLLLAYDNEQDRLRREEEQKRQADARQAEEARRLAEAAAMETEAIETGDQALLEQAMEMVEQPIVAPAIAPVEKQTPKVSGVSYREVWKFRIVNPSLIPREYLAVDDSKIGQVVRAMKGATKIPGIVAYADKQVAAGSR
jgi:hypothetical protein